jgi:hypothetical protein
LDRLYRRGDISGRQGRGRDLVKKRLNQMVVAATNQDNLGVGFFQGTRCGEAAKPAINYNNTWGQAGKGQSLLNCP